MILICYHQPQLISFCRIKWWKQKRGGGACVAAGGGGGVSELGLPNVAGVFLVTLAGCVGAA